ncbi:hypothetical protein F2Q69_00016449 [Brassica cretica]|uniref:Cyclin-like domain-containing protein n=1 Tax=Brassica cretica TaxID=69181 RepID=A0A8S9R0R3_BRACR|nr:hypothetical protein F2Q69_00016449 [Brassica cretica]
MMLTLVTVIVVIVALVWAFFKSLPWILRNFAGITLDFQFDGWNCLKNVVLHFNKGSIESIFVGEFKANLSQSLVELCATAFIQDPKVIFSICDLKIVTRPPSSSREVSFGVGYEPVLTDLSYAFTVALRRANLSLKGPGLILPPKKEKSLPWWDEMRNYVHGNTTLSFSKTKWTILATPDPYEKHDKLEMTSAAVEIQQSDGRVHFSAEEMKIYMTSFESLARRYPNAPPCPASYPFLEAPRFSLEVRMDWECESGSPMNHYLYALPVEGKAREFIYDPFRSTSLSLRFDFTLRPERHNLSGSELKAKKGSIPPPTLNVGAHDMAWLIRFWNMNYLPPLKIRTFSRWPRFGVPRIPRSGNLSMDRVMTEFMLRADVSPICINHKTLDPENPARGLTFNMSKLKFEMCLSRGNQVFTFDCVRQTLDPVYQGIDLHVPKAFIKKDHETVKMTRTSSQSGSTKSGSDGPEKHPDEGFLFSSDYFTIRRQAPKADPERMMVWKEEGKMYREKVDAKPTNEKDSESDQENSHSDPSDDDGFNVACAHYNFGTLCICLSMNYLDRFLASYDLPKDKTWALQLLAVSCLSLAAKMEESDVPQTVELQVGDPKFVFEAKTIKRMELLVLNTLNWRLQALTPFSFVDYFIYKTNGHVSENLIYRSSQFILNTTKAIEFLDFRPSEVAAAAAMSASISGEIKCIDDDKTLSNLTYVKQERVMGCSSLMRSLTGDNVPGAAKLSPQQPRLTARVVPVSPIGVLEATCLSYKSDERTFESCTNSSQSSPDTNNNNSNKRRRKQ